MRHFLAVLTSWGPFGLFGVATLESAGIPNPAATDLLLIALAITHPGEANLAAGLAVLGSLLGSIVFFEITRKGAQLYLARHTSSGRGARFRAWFLRYGLVTVFVAGLLPVPLPLKAFVACAAATGVSRTRFLVVLTVARVPRYLGLAYLGAHLGKNAPEWFKSHVWQMAVFAVVLFVGLYALIRWSGRNRIE